MILVLLYRFCESLDSIIGYKLCEQLVHEGHDVLVTTTSKADQREAEKEAAQGMTELYKGSINILEPECEELEEPSPEWIAKLRRTYFPQLELQEGIQTVIGILPGTSQTAVELKEILNYHVILLATTKVTLEEEVKKEVLKLLSYADQVWSMGSDIYSYYDAIFSEQPKGFAREVPHKNILLKPEIESSPETVHSNSQSPVESDRLITIWNEEYPYYFKGKEKCAMGSKKKNFSVLCSALQKISKERSMNLHLDIKGLKGKDSIVEDVLKAINEDLLKINVLSNVNFLQELSWKQCMAFIVPDFEDESFNFLALTAMWLGIPTFVSTETIIGKFIQSLDTSLKFKPLVNLTGDNETDTKVWMSKIEELFSKDNNPRSWAKGLAEFLRSHLDTCKLEMSALDKPFVQFSHQGALDSDSLMQREGKGSQATAYFYIKKPKVKYSLK